MGLNTDSVTPVSIRTVKDSFPVWRVVYLSQLRGRIGRSPCRSLEPQFFRNGRALEILVRGLKAHKVLKFVIIFLPMSWLFAVIAETKRFFCLFVLFRALHLSELKIKNCSSFSFSDTSRVQAS